MRPWRSSTEAGTAFRERRYVELTPTGAELDAVLRDLGMEPWEPARLSEPVAAELGLRDMPHDRARWIAAMVTPRS